MESQNGFCAVFKCFVKSGFVKGGDKTASISLKAVWPFYWILEDANWMGSDRVATPFAYVQVTFLVWLLLDETRKVIIVPLAFSLNLLVRIRATSATDSLTFDLHMVMISPEEAFALTDTENTNANPIPIKYIKIFIKISFWWLAKCNSFTRDGPRGVNEPDYVIIAYIQENC